MLEKLKIRMEDASGGGGESDRPVGGWKGSERVGDQRRGCCQLSGLFGIRGKSRMTSLDCLSAEVKAMIVTRECEQVWGSQARYRMVLGARRGYAQ